jgi:ATP-dependent RNA helicase DeaD
VKSMKFEELNLHPMLLKQVYAAGYKEPTKIQEKCIPLIKDGKDVVAQSETGSGKTAAFGLPILEKLVPRGGIQVLVLTPTRELCVQVSDVFRQFGRAMGVSTASIYGGVGIGPQFDALKRCEIVVGTPGRILDHIERRSINFSRVQFLVVDEVDKMAEMGFMEPVEEIIGHLPNSRQTLLFSATLSDEVDTLANRHSNAPIKVMTESLVSKDKLKQTYYDVAPKEKFSLLVHLLKTRGAGLKLIFCATRNEVDIVHKNLKVQGIKSAAIHGGLTQNKRTYALQDLKDEKIEVLVATDVAARGLDIPRVTFVYNYDVPKTSEDYVHRIGRTARAGKNGEAITILTDRDYENFDSVLRDHELKIEAQELPKITWVPFTRRMEGDRDERRGFGGRRFGGENRGRSFSREGPRSSPRFSREEGGSRVFPERSGEGYSTRTSSPPRRREGPEGRTSSFQRPREGTEGTRTSSTPRPREGFENRMKESEAPGRSGYSGYSQERHNNKRRGQPRPRFGKRNFHN